MMNKMKIKLSFIILCIPNPMIESQVYNKNYNKKVEKKFTLNAAKQNGFC